MLKSRPRRAVGKPAIVAAVLMFCAAACVRDAWAQSASTTALSLASGTVASGKPVAMTATVTAAGKPVTPGLIIFCNATARYCGGTDLLGSGQLTANGTAHLNVVLGLGTHQVKAVFTGTRSASASSSVSQTVTVTGVNPSVASLTATGGPSAYKLVASFSSTGTHVPTGTVSIQDASNKNAVITTATLGGGTTQSSWLSSQLASTGSLPSALVTADFNSDGIPDIAISNLNPVGGTYVLTIYLGNGDGSFQTVLPSRETGASPAALVAGDFNNDGLTDLAVANSVSNNVTILLGNGDGTFHVAVTAPATGVGPSAIVSADFNSDGNADLAVTNQSDNTVVILLGDGKGGFAEPAATRPVTGYFPTAAATGDFNGDGRMDLAVANYFADNMTILLGNGDGTFSVGASPVTGVYPDWVAIGDFNADGKLDLAITNQYQATLTILLGDGKGGFAAPAAPGYLPPITGSAPSSVSVGDIDGDGAADLVVTNQGGSSITLFMGKGDGTFITGQTLSTGSGSAPRSAAIKDFNGDGYPDIAAADSGLNQVKIFRRARYVDGNRGRNEPDHSGRWRPQYCGRLCGRHDRRRRDFSCRQFVRERNRYYYQTIGTALRNGVHRTGGTIHGQPFTGHHGPGSHHGYRRLLHGHGASRHCHSH